MIEWAECRGYYEAAWEVAEAKEREREFDEGLRAFSDALDRAVQALPNVVLSALVNPRTRNATGECVVDALKDERDRRRRMAPLLENLRRLAGRED